MRSMIITPKPEDPEVQTLSKEFETRGYDVKFFIPSTIKVKINISKFQEVFENLDPNGALVRGFGVAPTQKIFFRLDLLNAIEEYGIKLINSRESLEIASDKFLTSIYLEKHNIPTPKTIICENANDALDSFEELGGDIVLKPLYGSKGVGITRINDKGFAENVFHTLGQLNKVFYLQEFIEHSNRDIRILVLGNKAVAGMYRVSDNWKTNIYFCLERGVLLIRADILGFLIRFFPFFFDTSSGWSTLIPLPMYRFCLFLAVFFIFLHLK